jgi:hypothetical protein
LLHSQSTSSGEPDYMLRPLFELDQISKGEAYPWISDDGLRIYYTAHDDVSERSSIWYSERNSIDEDFSYHQLLSCNSNTHDNLSSWVSKDEKTMAFVVKEADEKRNSAIYLTKRQNIHNEFDKAEKITIQGGIRGTLISPSFTDDLSQMFVFNEYKSNSYIMVFERLDDLTYSYKAELKFPSKYRVKTGKLSHDGLEYYLSLEEKSKNPALYILSRENLKENFVPIVKYDQEDINDGQYRNHQVYFSNQKDFIVFTRSEENEWSTNGIYIAQKTNLNVKPIVKIEESFNTVSDILAYPNPAIDYVFFKNPNGISFNIEVYDFQGRIVHKTNFDKATQKMGISNLPAGSYIIKITDPETKNFKILKQVKL